MVGGSCFLHFRQLLGSFSGSGGDVESTLSPQIFPSGFPPAVYWPPLCPQPNLKINLSNNC